LENALSLESETKFQLLSDFFGEEEAFDENLRRKVASLASKSKISKSLEKFRTEKSLNRYFSNKPEFVTPVEIRLGENSTTKCIETCQYVPILKTLESLLKHDDVLSQVFEDKENIRHFKDGEVFKINPLFSQTENSLLINLYVCEQLRNVYIILVFLLFYYSIVFRKPPLGTKPLSWYQAFCIDQRDFLAGQW